VATIKERVQEALDQIRPAIQMDGGDVELVDVTEDNVVQLRLMGACHGCPMSMLTLQAGIERIVKAHVPEIAGVEAI
jgi:Fe-S cluster biogenesis protein NfuA